MKRRFTIGVLIGSVVGLLTGVCLSYLALDHLHSMGQPMNRVAAAAESSAYTYQIYLYAPYSVAENYLNRHAVLLENLAEESSEEIERDSFLQDLAANQARRAKLATKNGDSSRATVLLDEAMAHLRDSGSLWSEEELRRFVDRLDESNLEKAPPKNVGTPSESGTDVELQD